MNKIPLSLGLAYLISPLSLVAQTFYISGEGSTEAFTTGLDGDFLLGAGAATHLSTGDFAGAADADANGDDDTLFLDFGSNLSATVRDVNWRDDGDVSNDVFDTNVGTIEGSYSGTAQEQAPTTTDYVGAYFNNFNSNGSGSTSTPNAQLFSFNQNIDAFGAFFGDLETGIPDSGLNSAVPNISNPQADGSGRAYAVIVLLDSSYNEIVRQVVDNFILDGVAYDQTFGGSTDSSGGYNFVGNGNRTTRHVGFVDTASSVRHVLVAVGDDDTTFHDLNDAMGGREFLSSFGFAASAAPEPSSAFLLAMGGGVMMFGRRR